MENLKLNKNGRISNVLLSILALFIVIVVIIFIVNKANNNRNYDYNFSQNLNNMFETAKEYFSDKLPEKEGSSNSLSLKEMRVLNLSNKLYYGKVLCDEKESYISITKRANGEYNLKANLKCGNKEDNIIEKVKSSITVEDENGNEIINNDKANITINKDDDYDNISCYGPECSFIEIPTKCETTYAYEFVRRVLSCADGYTYFNGMCVKEETTDSEITIIKAKLNTGITRVYSDVIVNKSADTYSCKNGELIGKYCYQYKEKEKNTSSSCPSGYTKDGNYCYSYKDYIKKESSSCPSGYTKDGNYCYNYKDYVVKESKKCPSGYSDTGSKCTKTVAGEIRYTNWNNPTKTYQTSTKESTYTNELTKKVLIGTNTVKNSTIYTYAIYNRSKYTYCASGTVSGSQCVTTKDYTTSSTKTCPSGYSDNGSKCYIKKAINTVTTETCPSGYSDNGSKCYIKKAINTVTTKTCPSGYSDNGSNCYKRTNADIKEGTTSYKCSTGYTKTGSGNETKCYKDITVEGTYYCENENAILKDNLCYVKGTTCPDGFEYNKNDNLCHKQISINPSYEDAEIVYSDKQYLEGYQRTGRASYKNICTRISK